MTLAEYAARHPYQETEEEQQEREAREKDYLQEQQERQEARDIMAAVLQALEAGTRAQAVLYTLLPAVGILSHNRAWEERARKLLEAHYIAEDLNDESQAAEEARKTARAANEYADKTRKKLASSLKQCRELEQTLTKSLEVLGDVLEPPEEFTKIEE